jgi:serine/threonine-protein kinase
MALAFRVDDNTIDYGSAEDRARIGQVTGGRYSVMGELGRGGMSRVLLGWDRLARRKVALKILDDEAGATVEGRERFRREAMIASRINHPHVVSCEEFVQQGTFTLAVMRFIPGDSLERRLTDRPWSNIGSLLEILVPVADALASIHSHGVIHRDVKPANILLRAGDDSPFLTDFGIATLKTSEQSRSEVARKFGTPEYMSPEQALGLWDADHRSDIYSLGLVAYRALAGKLPFAGTSPLAQAAQRAALDVPPLRTQAPHVPRPIADVIDRCLARDPRKRWRDAVVLRDELAEAFSTPTLFRRIRAALRAAGR